MDKTLVTESADELIGSAEIDIMAADNLFTNPKYPVDRMKEMTEEEADYWDEYFTNNTVMPDMSKPGFFAQKYGMTIKLDPETTQFLVKQAETTHKTFTEIIGDLVKEKIAVSI